MSSKLEPAILSHDTGQRIPYFDSCQLTIAWMFNNRETHCKLGINQSKAAMLRNVVAGRKRLRSMFTMRKDLDGFLFLCMHVILFL